MDIMHTHAAYCCLCLSSGWYTLTGRAMENSGMYWCTSVMRTTKVKSKNRLVVVRPLMLG